MSRKRRKKTRQSPKSDANGDKTAVSVAPRPAIIFTAEAVIAVHNIEQLPDWAPFTPKPCNACPVHRKALLAQGRIDAKTAKNPSEVYSKHGRTRYCRCRVCGRTWKEVANER